MAKNNNTSSDSFEKNLFKAADKLRKNIDAAEYKHIVLGLVFLKYISDSFEEMYKKISRINICPIYGVQFRNKYQS